MVRKSIPVIAVTLSLALLLQDVVWAAPDAVAAAASSWRDGVSASGRSAHIPHIGFRVPESAGFIDDGFLTPASADPGAPGRLVILLQDAHVNPSAQLNAARIIGLAAREGGIRTVYTEGAEGVVTLSDLLPAGPRSAHVRASAEALLRKGRLTGFEYADLSSPGLVRLMGVEDEALYTEALTRYRSAVSGRTVALRFIGRAERAANTLADELLGNELQELRRLRAAHAAGDVSTADHFERVAAAGSARGLRPRSGELRNLRLFRSLVREERQLDFETVAAEQAEALAALTDEDRRALGELPDDAGVLSRSAYWASARERGAAVRSGSQLERYLAYLSRARALDAAAAMDELERFEQAVWLRIAPSETARELLTVIRSLDTLRALITLQATPAAFSRYLSARAAHDPARISAFLNSQFHALGRHYDQAVFLDDAYDAAERSARDFYELSSRRDAAMAAKLAATMEAAGETRAMLVAGGFHAPGLERELRARGISYVSIVPAATHPTDNLLYENILYGRSAPAFRSSAVRGPAPSEAGSGPVITAARDLMPRPLAAALRDGITEAVETAAALGLDPAAGLRAVTGARLTQWDAVAASDRTQHERGSVKLGKYRYVANDASAPSPVRNDGDDVELIRLNRPLGNRKDLFEYDRHTELCLRMIDEALEDVRAGGVTAFDFGAGSGALTLRLAADPSVDRVIAVEHGGDEVSKLLAALELNGIDHERTGDAALVAAEALRPRGAAGRARPRVLVFQGKFEALVEAMRRLPISVPSQDPVPAQEGTTLFVGNLQDAIGLQMARSLAEFLDSPAGRGLKDPRIIIGGGWDVSASFGRKRFSATLPVGAEDPNQPDRLSYAKAAEEMRSLRFRGRVLREYGREYLGLIGRRADPDLSAEQYADFLRSQLRETGLSFPRLDPPSGARMSDASSVTVAWTMKADSAPQASGADTNANPEASAARSARESYGVPVDRWGDPDLLPVMRWVIGEEALRYLQRDDGIVRAEIRGGPKEGIYEIEIENGQDHLIFIFSEDRASGTVRIAHGGLRIKSRRLGADEVQRKERIEIDMIRRFVEAARSGRLLGEVPSRIRVEEVYPHKVEFFKKAGFTIEARGQGPSSAASESPTASDSPHPKTALSSAELELTPAERPATAARMASALRRITVLEPGGLHGRPSGNLIALSSRLRPMGIELYLYPLDAGLRRNLEEDDRPDGVDLTSLKDLMDMGVDQNDQVELEVRADLSQHQVDEIAAVLGRYVARPLSDDPSAVVRGLSEIVDAAYPIKHDPGVLEAVNALIRAKDPEEWMSEDAIADQLEPLAVQGHSWVAGFGWSDEQSYILRLARHERDNRFIHHADAAHRRLEGLDPRRVPGHVLSGTTSDGRAYLWTTRLPILTYKDWLGRLPQPSPDRAALVIASFAELAAQAHDRGMVLYDVSRTNVGVTAEGQGAIFDFDHSPIDRERRIGRWVWRREPYDWLKDPLELRTFIFKRFLGTTHVAKLAEDKYRPVPQMDVRQTADLLQASFGEDEWSRYPAIVSVIERARQSDPERGIWSGYRDAREFAAALRDAASGARMADGPAAADEEDPNAAAAGSPGWSWRGVVNTVFFALHAAYPWAAIYLYRRWTGGSLWDAVLSLSIKPIIWFMGPGFVTALISSGIVDHDEARALEAASAIKARLIGSAGSLGDTRLERSLTNSKITILPITLSSMGEILHPGKRGDHILIPSQLSYDVPILRQLIAYLLVRRSIGADYDRKVRAWASGPSFSKMQPGPVSDFFWAFLGWGDFESLKRFRHYPVLLPYLIWHLMFAAISGITILIPMVVGVLDPANRNLLRGMVRILLHPDEGVRPAERSGDAASGARMADSPAAGRQEEWISRLKTIGFTEAPTAKRVFVGHEFWNEIADPYGRYVVLGDYLFIDQGEWAEREGVLMPLRDKVIVTQMGREMGPGTREGLIFLQAHRDRIKDKTVFDAGSRTGVFAILALKLGAKRVILAESKELYRWLASENLQSSGIGSDRQIEFIEDLAKIDPDLEADVVLSHLPNNGQFQALLEPGQWNHILADSLRPRDYFLLDFQFPRTEYAEKFQERFFKGGWLKEDEYAGLDMPGAPPFSGAGQMLFHHPQNAGDPKASRQNDFVLDLRNSGLDPSDAEAIFRKTKLIEKTLDRIHGIRKKRRDLSRLEVQLHSEVGKMRQVFLVTAEFKDSRIPPKKFILKLTRAAAEKDYDTLAHEMKNFYINRKIGRVTGVLQYFGPADRRRIAATGPWYEGVPFDRVRDDLEAQIAVVSEVIGTWHKTQGAYLADLHQMQFILSRRDERGWEARLIDKGHTKYDPGRHYRIDLAEQDGELIPISRDADLKRISEWVDYANETRIVHTLLDDIASTPPSAAPKAGDWIDPDDEMLGRVSSYLYRMDPEAVVEGVRRVLGDGGARLFFARYFLDRERREDKWQIYGVIQKKYPQLVSTGLAYPATALRPVRAEKAGSGWRAIIALPDSGGTYQSLVLEGEPVSGRSKKTVVRIGSATYNRERTGFWDVGGRRHVHPDLQAALDALEEEEPHLSALREFRIPDLDDNALKDLIEKLAREAESRLTAGGSFEDWRHMGGFQRYLNWAERAVRQNDGTASFGARMADADRSEGSKAGRDEGGPWLTPEQEREWEAAWARWEAERANRDRGEIVPVEVIRSAIEEGVRGAMRYDRAMNAGGNEENLRRILSESKGLAERLSRLELRRGSSALVVGPGHLDLLPWVLKKCGLDVEVVEPDPSARRSQNALMDHMPLSGIKIRPKLSGAAGPKYDFIFMISIHEDGSIPLLSARRMDWRPAAEKYLNRLTHDYGQVVPLLRPEGVLLINRSIDDKELAQFTEGALRRASDQHKVRLTRLNRPDVVRDLTLSIPHAGESRFGDLWQASRGARMAQEVRAVLELDPVMLTRLKPNMARINAVLSGQEGPDQIYGRRTYVLLNDPATDPEFIGKALVIKGLTDKIWKVGQGEERLVRHSGKGRMASDRVVDRSGRLLEIPQLDGHAEGMMSYVKAKAEHGFNRTLFLKQRDQAVIPVGVVKFMNERLLYQGEEAGAVLMIIDDIQDKRLAHLMNDLARADMKDGEFIDPKHGALALDVGRRIHLAAEALRTLHQTGIVHRHLHFGNVGLNDDSIAVRDMDGSLRAGDMTRDQFITWAGWDVEYFLMKLEQDFVRRQEIIERVLGSDWRDRLVRTYTGNSGTDIRTAVVRIADGLKFGDGVDLGEGRSNGTLRDLFERGKLPDHFTVPDPIILRTDKSKMSKDPEDVLIANGDYAGVVRMYEDGSRTVPSDTRKLFNLIVSLLVVKRDEEAGRLFWAHSRDIERIQPAGGARMAEEYLDRPYEFYLSGGRAYHEILGVAAGAAVDEAKSHWKKLVQKWHPDKNPENWKQANEVCGILNDAFRALKNGDLRSWASAKSWSGGVYAEGGPGRYAQESTGSDWGDPEGDGGTRSYDWTRSDEAAYRRYTTRYQYSPEEEEWFRGLRSRSRGVAGISIIELADAARTDPDRIIDRAAEMLSEPVEWGNVAGPTFAAWLLVEIGTYEALRELFAVLHKPWEYRSGSRRVMEESIELAFAERMKNPEGIEALALELERLPMTGRKHAIWGLASIGTERAVDLIMARHLKELQAQADNGRFRVTVTEAFKSFDNPEQWPRVKAWLERVRDDRDYEPDYNWVGFNAQITLQVLERKFQELARVLPEHRAQDTDPHAARMAVQRMSGSMEGRMLAEEPLMTGLIRRGRWKLIHNGVYSAVYEVKSGKDRYAVKIAQPSRATHVLKDVENLRHMTSDPVLKKRIPVLLEAGKVRILHSSVLEEGLGSGQGHDYEKSVSSDYMITRTIPGTDLRQRMKRWRKALGRERKFVKSEIVTAYLGIAKALKEWHDRGRVHGDLNRGSILWRDRDGEISFLDLGMSRSLSGGPALAHWSAQDRWSLYLMYGADLHDLGLGDELWKPRQNLEGSVRLETFIRQLEKELETLTSAARMADIASGIPVEPLPPAERFILNSSGETMKEVAERVGRESAQLGEENLFGRLYGSHADPLAWKLRPERGGLEFREKLSRMTLDELGDAILEAEKRGDLAGKADEETPTGRAHLKRFLDELSDLNGLSHHIGNARRYDRFEEMGEPLVAEVPEDEWRSAERYKALLQEIARRWSVPTDEEKSALGNFFDLASAWDVDLWLRLAEAAASISESRRLGSKGAEPRSEIQGLALSESISRLSFISFFLQNSIRSVWVRTHLEGRTDGPMTRDLSSGEWIASHGSMGDLETIGELFAGYSAGDRALPNGALKGLIEVIQFENSQLTPGTSHRTVRDYLNRLIRDLDGSSDLIGQIPTIRPDPRVVERFEQGGIQGTPQVPYASLGAYFISKSFAEREDRLISFRDAADRYVRVWAELKPRLSELAQAAFADTSIPPFVPDGQADLDKLLTHEDAGSADFSRWVDLGRGTLSDEERDFLIRFAARIHRDTSLKTRSASAGEGLRLPVGVALGPEPGFAVIGVREWKGEVALFVGRNVIYRGAGAELDAIANREARNASEASADSAARAAGEFERELVDGTAQLEGSPDFACFIQVEVSQLISKDPRTRSAELRLLMSALEWIKDQRAHRSAEFYLNTSGLDERETELVRRLAGSLRMRIGTLTPDLIRDHNAVPVVWRAARSGSAEEGIQTDRASQAAFDGWVNILFPEPGEGLQPYGRAVYLSRASVLGAVPGTGSSKDLWEDFKRARPEDFDQATFNRVRTHYPDNTFASAADFLPAIREPGPMRRPALLSHLIRVGARLAELQRAVQQITISA